MEKSFSLDQTIGVVCEECGNNVFEEKFFIRKASKFLMGTSKDILQTIPALSCSKCGHINDELNPLKSIKDEDAI